MALRLTMQHLIDYTKQVLGQSKSVESPFEGERIEDMLDQTVQRFEWYLLDHDADYKNYYCRPPTQRITENLALPVDSIIAVDNLGELTFSGWSRIGFIEASSTPTSLIATGGYEIRTARSFDEGSEKLPDSHTPNQAAFVYNSAVDLELYINCRAYDPYRAAIMLMLESPNIGMAPVLRQGLGKRSETYGIEEKIKHLKRMSAGINRKQRRLYRS